MGWECGKHKGEDMYIQGTCCRNSEGMKQLARSALRWEGSVKIYIKK